jgi:hypothetical protein
MAKQSVFESSARSAQTLRPQERHQDVGIPSSLGAVQGGSDHHVLTVGLSSCAPKPAAIVVRVRLTLSPLQIRRRASESGQALVVVKDGCAEEDYRRPFLL